MRTKDKRLTSFISTFLFIFTLFNTTFSLNVKAYTSPALTQDLKVGLVSMANTSLTVVLNENYTINGSQFPSGTILNIKLANGFINVNGTDYSEVQIIPGSSENLLTLTSGTTSIKYFGNFLLKVISGKIVPINLIGMDNYLKGVVGYEMSDSFPIEALKAQAVAARNYALSKIGYESAKGYDFDDTVMYQVYKGFDERLKNSIRAVEETSGIVLLYSDRLVETLYSAWHGGYSEDSVNVWGNAVPYLKAKQDSFENDPWPSGNRVFTSSQIDSTLKTKGYIFPTETFVKLDLASITRYPSGRVANINIIYKDVAGTTRTKSLTKDKTRVFLALPSNMYNVSYDSVNGVYTFSGKGNGHGLGMSQIGAKNRASAGETFEQILKFYYDGAYLQKTTYKAAIGSFTISSNQVYTNESVNIAAQGTGGSGQYLYRYDIKLNGINILNTQYGDSSSLSYKAVQAGSYEVIAYIKDKLSNVTFDETQSKYFNVIDRPVSKIASFTKSIEKSLVGQQINFQASAPEGSLYKFEVQKNGSVIQSTSYNSVNTFSITPMEAGNYIVKTYTKHPVSLNEFDDSKELELTVFSNPTIVSFASTASESYVGQKIDVTTSSQGGSGIYLYKYTVLKDQNLIAESDYSSSVSYSFIPQNAGSYQISVSMKDSLSSVENDTKTLNITIINYSASLDASISKTSTLIGQPIKVTAVGSNGSGQGYTYKYEVVRNGSVIAQKAYGAESNYSYAPSSNGIYEVKVYVKDAASPKEYDSIKTLGFTAYSLPQILGVKSIGSMYIDTPVTITTTLSSQSGAGVQSRYEIYQDSLLVSEKNLGAATEFIFTPDKSGKYTFRLYVKDNISENSYDSVKTFDMNILPQPMSIKNFPVYRGMQGPAVVTIQTGLTKLGYPIGTIDGIFGAKTETGVINFQKSVKLKPTGIVDTVTFDAMNNALITKVGLLTTNY